MSAGSSPTVDPAGTDPGAMAQADDIRPVVPVARTGRLGVIAFLVLLVLGGAWIVSLMSEQRAALQQGGPFGTGNADPDARITSPPPLALPNAYGFNPLGEREGLEAVRLRPEPSQEMPAPRVVAAPIVQSETPVAPSYDPYPIPQTVMQPPPQVTFAPPELPPVANGQAAATSPARVRADRFANPSRTVPQGTVIPAVLETAIDSTKPGGVRALVQRNIHAFDGSRVLIPRGSRLYGEYDAQIERGENRALIRWTRLIRPDGVIIALDSPASDPLGRAGIKGKVDGKFFQRFGGALLQSVLDIGVGVATREATDGVIVALPGSTQNVTPRVSEGEIRPTLKVRHGTSVSVFVARDLDFSSVE